MVTLDRPALLKAAPRGGGSSTAPHASVNAAVRAGHATRRLRLVGRLRSQLLRQSRRGAGLLRRLRPRRAVRPCQRRRRRAHEAPRGPASFLYRSSTVSVHPGVSPPGWTGGHVHPTFARGCYWD